MVFGGLVLTGLLAWNAFAAVGVARRMAARVEDRAELALTSLLVFYGAIIAPVFALGYTGTLTRGRLALASLALATVIVAGCCFAVGLRAHLRTTGRAMVSLCWLPLDALAVTLRARSVAAALLATSLGMIVLSAILAYLAPSESWDGLFYHEPIIGFALQNHGFADVPLSANPMAQTINGYPRGCEAFAIFFVAFTDRSLIEIGNTIAAAGLICAVYLLARRFTEAAAAIGWASLVLLMPAMWTELRSTYTDVELLFFVMASLHLATRPRLRWRDAAMALLAMALSIAGKGTGLTLVPPMALVLAIRLVVWMPRGRRIAAIGWALLGSITLLAVAALTLIPNWQRHHNPVWPVTLDVPRLHLHLEGLIRYKDMNPEGTFRQTFAEKYAIPQGGPDDAHNRDYGYAYPWVIIPLGILSALAAVVVFVTQRIRRRRGTARESKAPGIGTGNLVVLVSIAVVWFALANNLRWARFNAQSLFVLTVALAWAGGRPGWSRFADGTLGMAAALSLLPLFWMQGWYWGLSPKQIRRLVHLPAAARAAAYVDANSMPEATAVARDAELQAGDLLVFNQDETWIGLLWNPQFTNRVEYVPSDTTQQFAAEIEARKPKWVVIGGNEVAQRVIVRHPETWEAVGVATIIDGTTAYRRKPAAP
jgi:4-amino-4-deoxy-L-arabinose transferase-like glycosyltransferase